MEHQHLLQLLHGSYKIIYNQALQGNEQDSQNAQPVRIEGMRNVRFKAPVKLS